MFQQKKSVWRVLSLMLAVSVVAAACAQSSDSADAALETANDAKSLAQSASEGASAAQSSASAAQSSADAAQAAADAAASAASAAAAAANAANETANLADAKAEGSAEKVAEAEAALEAAELELEEAKAAAEAAERKAADALEAASAPPPPPPPPPPAAAAGPPGLMDKPQGWVPPEASVDTARAWPTAQVELPKLTIGYLQVLGASEAAQRLEFTAKDAVDYLGWDWEYCDAEGVPDAMQTCLAGFVASGVDAIVTDGTTVEAIADGLPAAREAGIPFVNTGGTQSFYHLYAASFNPNDYRHGIILAEWMVDNTDKAGEVQVSSVNFAAWGIDRETALKEVIDGTDITIGDEEVIDFADAINGPADAASRWLIQAPDSVAFWLTIDVAAIGVGPIISQTGLSPPDRPLVLTWYANCATQQQMQAGGVDASVEENLEWGSYVAMDQIAEYFANGQQFSDELRPYYLNENGDAVQFSVPFIVTPDDIGSDCDPGRGPYPAPSDPMSAGFVEFFENRWAAAFSNIG